MMIMEVNGTAIQIKLEQNSSVDAIKELLRQGSITIPMKDYAHMEKFGNLGTRLPRNDKQITTKAEMLFSEGNLLVIYYAPNTWKFTRLGKVVNLTEKELKKVLGKGNIMATLILKDE